MREGRGQQYWRTNSLWLSILRSFFGALRALTAVLEARSRERSVGSAAALGLPIVERVSTLNFL